MNKFRSLWVGLGAAFLLAACAGNTPAPVSPEPVAEQSGETEAALVAPGEATMGDETRCPVSGHSFVVDADSPKVEHEGKTYFFCCPGCDEKFLENPAKYLEASS